MAQKDTWRVVTRGTDGELIIRDFDSADGILRTHLQVGIDDCSTDLGLRGAPVFRSLIGPMPEGLAPPIVCELFRWKPPITLAQSNVAPLPTRIREQSSQPTAFKSSVPPLMVVVPR